MSYVECKNCEYWRGEPSLGEDSIERRDCRRYPPHHPGGYTQVDWGCGDGEVRGPTGGELTAEVARKYALPVRSLALGERARTALESLNVKTVGQLVKLTEQDLLPCCNFGETSLQQIISALASIGLYLSSDE